MQRRAVDLRTRHASRNHKDSAQPTRRTVPPPRQEPPPLVIPQGRVRGDTIAPRTGIERFRARFGDLHV